MRVKLYKKNGSMEDITILNASITTSGDLRKVARDLTLDITRKGVDYYMPAFTGSRGDSVVILDDEGEELYRGIIWELSIDSTGTDIEMTCYDSLIYMNKSESKDSIFTNKTAEEVTAQILEEFGLEVGDLAETGQEVRLNGRGKTGYEIMMSAYTEASRINEKKYYPMMNKNKVDVIEKGTEIENFIIEYKNEGVPGHLIRLTYKESSEDLITKILTVGESGDIISEELNQEDIDKYGVIQKVAQNASDTDAKTKEETKLNSGKKSVEVECIGDWRLRTGYSVRIKSDELDLDEVLYIESDRHTIANGFHFTNLTLSYENEMDEYEMKEDKSSSGGGTGAGTVPGDTNEIKLWNFFRSKGYSAEAVAGILGNLRQESRFNPGAIEGGTGEGYGLAQWSFSRKPALWNWLAANGYARDDLIGQAEYIIYEMEQTYGKLFPGGLEGFKSIADVSKATYLFHKIFEGSADTESMIQNNRVAPANELYNRLKAQEISGQVGSGDLHNIASEYKTLYQWGGSHHALITDPNARYDCSSFARAVMYRWKGVDIGGYTVPQEKAGVEVPLNSLQPGDLLFYGNRGSTHHIAIYAGNNKMYEAQQDGVPIGIFNYRTASFARRV